MRTQFARRLISKKHLGPVTLQPPSSCIRPTHRPHAAGNSSSSRLAGCSPRPDNTSTRYAKGVRLAGSGCDQRVESSEICSELEIAGEEKVLATERDASQPDSRACLNALRARLVQSCTRLSALRSRQPRSWAAPQCSSIQAALDPPSTQCSSFSPAPVLPSAQRSSFRLLCCCACLNAVRFACSRAGFR